MQQNPWGIIELESLIYRRDKMKVDITMSRSVLSRLVNLGPLVLFHIHVFDRGIQIKNGL